MLWMLNHLSQFLPISFLYLSLNRIQALSPGNQKEVTGHHEAPEKSKKGWDVDSDTQLWWIWWYWTDWTIVSVKLAPSRGSFQESQPSQIKMAGAVAEAHFQLWICACLALINQRCCSHSWLCFLWPLPLPVFNFPFSCRIYCNTSAKG